MLLRRWRARVHRSYRLRPQARGHPPLPSARTSGRGFDSYTLPPLLHQVVADRVLGVAVEPPRCHLPSTPIRGRMPRRTRNKVARHLPNGRCRPPRDRERAPREGSGSPGCRTGARSPRWPPPLRPRKRTHHVSSRQREPQDCHRQQRPGPATNDPPAAQQTSIERRRSSAVVWATRRSRRYSPNHRHSRLPEWFQPRKAASVRVNHGDRRARESARRRAAPRRLADHRHPRATRASKR